MHLDQSKVEAILSLADIVWQVGGRAEFQKSRLAPDFC
jgi:hypothetical protein